mmetsp:Transcript_40168/g.89125  ORF Transcript_40168/g.89125 Transcript_40168/m.89125 type:complete len:97 (+) Transcript_40168:846-1136(+)
MVVCKPMRGGSFVRSMAMEPPSSAHARVVSARAPDAVWKHDGGDGGRRVIRLGGQSATRLCATQLEGASCNWRVSSTHDLLWQGPELKQGPQAGQQ